MVTMVTLLALLVISQVSALLSPPFTFPLPSPFLVPTDWFDDCFCIHPLQCSCPHLNSMIGYSCFCIVMTALSASYIKMLL